MVIDRADTIQVLVVAVFPPGEGRIRLPAWPSDHNTRLIEATDEDENDNERGRSIDGHSSTNEPA